MNFFGLKLTVLGIKEIKSQDKEKFSAWTLMINVCTLLYRITVCIGLKQEQSVSIQTASWEQDQATAT